jgi:hypothetical protein
MNVTARPAENAPVVTINDASSSRKCSPYIDSLPAHVLPKGRSMMKGALIANASVGILAVTVAVESANAQYNMLYSPRTSPAYTPQSPWQANTPQSPWQAYTPQSRWQGYTPQSRGGRFLNPDSPAATGGGSFGYNQFRYWQF